MTWQPMNTAPRDGTHIVLRTKGGSVVLAYFGSLDDFAAWQAVNEGEHPHSWDDGVCWKTNSYDEPSDPPAYWVPFGTKKKGAQS